MGGWESGARTASEPRPRRAPSISNSNRPEAGPQSTCTFMAGGHYELVPTASRARSLAKRALADRGPLRARAATVARRRDPQGRRLPSDGAVEGRTSDEALDSRAQSCAQATAGPSVIDYLCLCLYVPAWLVSLYLSAIPHLHLSMCGSNSSWGTSAEKIASH